MNRKRFLLWVFLAYLALSAGLYANAIRGEFVQDDLTIIVDNPLVKDFRNLPRFFTTDIWTSAFHYPEVRGYYRPLQAVSFCFDHFLWKLDPAGYHCTNVLLHAANSFLLFLLVRGLSGSAPLGFVTGLLFACHPLHAEAVAFIADRSEILMAFFCFLAFLFSLKYWEREKGWLFLASLVSFACGLLTNEMMVFRFFPLMALLAVFTRSLRKPRFILHAGCLLGVAAAIFLIRMFVIPLEAPHRFLSPGLELLNAAYLFFRGISLLLVPAHLHALRMYQPLSSPASAYALAAIACCLVFAAVAWLALKHKERIPALAVGWLAAAHVFLFVAMFKFAPMVALEEHWLYVPSAGFFLLAAWLIVRTGRPAIPVLIAVVAVWSALTMQAAARWKTKIGYYTYNIRYNPGLVLFRVNLAHAYAEKGLMKEAMGQLDIAERTGADDLVVLVTRGDLLRDRGKFAEAEREYRRALEADNLSFQAVGRLKDLYARQGKVYVDAVDTAFSPEERDVLLALRAGDFRRALVLAGENLRKERSPRYLTLGGLVFAKMGRFAEAEMCFKEALASDPGFAAARDNLAIVYEIQGKLIEREKLFEGAR